MLKISQKQQVLGLAAVPAPERAHLCQTEPDLFCSTAMPTASPHEVCDPHSNP